MPPPKRNPGKLLPKAVQKALNKGCSAQNQTIPLSITSSDCKVHVLPPWEQPAYTTCTWKTKLLKSFPLLGQLASCMPTS